jgi:hypothetical protein
MDFRDHPPVPKNLQDYSQIALTTFDQIFCHLWYLVAFSETVRLADFRDVIRLRTGSGSCFPRESTVRGGFEPPVPLPVQRFSKAPLPLVCD